MNQQNLGVDQDGGLTSGFYDELHAIARRIFAHEQVGHTLQPTAVVNEACMRLLTNSQLPESLPREDRLALAGRVLKQVLIDYARSRNAEKRGGGALRVELSEDLCGQSTERFQPIEEVHQALERLRALNERQAEVITLRVFAGLTMEQVAGVLGVSKRTAEDDWTVARAWMRRALSASATNEK